MNGDFDAADLKVVRAAARGAKPEKSCRRTRSQDLFGSRSACAAERVYIDKRPFPQDDIPLS